MSRTYLDWNATTPPWPEAAAAVGRALSEGWGNASSHHAFGREARAIVEEAREAVAAAVGATPREIVFTSGGTEANNLALKGAALAARERGRAPHVVTVRTEHHSIIDSAAALERAGFEITWIDVDADGALDPARFDAALRGDTAVASVMLANNEVGTVHPIADLARCAHRKGVIFHSDAVNALGKIPVATGDLGVDLLSVSAHKIRGPKGAGALFIRTGTPIRRIQDGGSHELEMRGGTENVPGIAGFGVAAGLVPRLLAAMDGVRALRDRLLLGLRERLPEIRVHGDPGRGLPNTLNVGFPGVDGRQLLAALDLEGLAVSGGSACASGAIEPSHVLKAMGVAEESARAAVRFSLGVATTRDEIERAIDSASRVVRNLRRR